MEHNLTAKQITAAQALAAGNSWKEAQALANCSSGSINKWLKDKDFKAFVRELQMESFQSTFAMMNELLPGITKRLSDIATGPLGDIPASVQVRAIQLLYETHLKYKELEDVEDRLAALEKGAERLEGKSSITDV